jgi:hypothetical protein
MKKYLGILVISLSLACNNSEQKSAEKKDSTVNKATTSAISFKDSKLQTLYTSYLNLKDALVAGKQQEATAASKLLSGDLKSYTGCENTGLIADKITTAKDLAGQRKEFTSLSADVIALFKHADLTAGTIYVQHCPMANNGDGGDWLSTEKKIQNPYYGAEMMECGSVIQEIKSK